MSSLMVLDDNIEYEFIRNINFPTKHIEKNGLKLQVEVYSFDMYNLEAQFNVKEKKLHLISMPFLTFYPINALLDKPVERLPHSILLKKMGANYLTLDVSLSYKKKKET